MKKIKFESILTNKIKNHSYSSQTFNDILHSFEKKYQEYNPTVNSFPLNKYFGIGSRTRTALNNLLEDKIIKPEWVIEYQTKNNSRKRDFRGIYTFVYNCIPIYVGISKGVIGRLCQHLKGVTHFDASLAFRIGLMYYAEENGKAFAGRRNELDYNTYIKPAQEFLLKQRAAVYPIDDPVELYLFEIYCSLTMKTVFNEFETH